MESAASPAAAPSTLKPHPTLTPSRRRAHTHSHGAPD